MPLHKLFIGDDRDRTGDPRLAKAVLYQLSYIPTQRCRHNIVRFAISLGRPPPRLNAAKTAAFSGGPFRT